MKVRTPILILLLILFGLFLCAIILGQAKPSDWNRFYDAEQRIHASAVPIIEALELYKSANGAYPKDLDSLIPAYLEALPAVDVGVGHWDYCVYSTPNEVFELSVKYKSDNYIKHYYHSDIKMWLFDS